MIDLYITFYIHIFILFGYSNNYSYIEDIGNHRGYTAGIIGFTTGTDDMVHLVKHYNKINPNNDLKKYTV